MKLYLISRYRQFLNNMVDVAEEFGWLGVPGHWDAETELRARKLALRFKWMNRLDYYIFSRLINLIATDEEIHDNWEDGNFPM